VNIRLYARTLLRVSVSVCVAAFIGPPAVVIDADLTRGHTIHSKKLNCFIILAMRVAFSVSQVQTPMASTGIASVRLMNGFCPLINFKMLGYNVRKTVGVLRISGI
jgi:hypothetical protein